MNEPHNGGVLSVEKFNSLVPRIVVAPITSQEHPEFGSLRIPIETVNKIVTGFICMDHIRTIDPVVRKITPKNDCVTQRNIASIRFVLKKIFGIV